MKELDPYNPHTPARELGNQYALHALRERRAFMSGELVKLEARRRYLQDSIVHLDATLAFMAPDYVPTLVESKFPRRKSKLFGAGKLNHLILGVLRKAERPMTQRKVTTGVRIDAGFDEGAEDGLRSRVRSNLLYLTKVRGLVVKDADRETATWRLTNRSDSFPPQGQAALKILPVNIGH